jgi:hypothetical protein
MNENNLKCPHCGEMWNDIECEVCGFADVEEVMIPCSHCEEMMPDWATTCVKCWDKLNRKV